MVLPLPLSLSIHPSHPTAAAAAKTTPHSIPSHPIGWLCPRQTRTQLDKKWSPMNPPTFPPRSSHHPNPPSATPPPPPLLLLLLLNPSPPLPVPDLLSPRPVVVLRVSPGASSGPIPCFVIVVVIHCYPRFSGSFRLWVCVRVLWGQCHHFDEMGFCGNLRAR